MLKRIRKDVFMNAKRITIIIIIYVARVILRANNKKKKKNLKKLETNTVLSDSIMLYFTFCIFIIFLYKFCIERLVG